MHNSKLQKDLISEYFLRVGRENANKAVRGEAPYSQEDHERVFKGVCVDFRVSADAMLFSNVGPSGQPSNPVKGGGGGLSSSKKSKQQTKSKNSNQKGGGSSKPVSEQKWPIYQGHGVCFAYNNLTEGRECKNPSHEKGCKGKNKKGEETVFAHVCAEWLGPRKGHCLGPHGRKDHTSS